MKRVPRKHNASQSCSCTSCLYKSESDQLSIRKYIAQGSRVSRLYFGKYIPVREQKLLNRLVRTRAVYDDLRARLISDSTLSLKKNADLRRRKHHRHIKHHDSEQSGAILELVDLIDKGGALDSKKLSECCSCCSCSSKVNILQEPKNDQKRKRDFVRSYEQDYGQSGQIGRRKDIYAKKYKREYREYVRTAPGRKGERHNKKGVHFKVKRIRSEPCTCTFKFSGFIKKHSKPMIRKIHKVPLEEPYIDVEEPGMEDLKKTRLARKSYQKYKALQGKLGQDIRKLNESSAKMKQNVQLYAKKSLEKVKRIKNKTKEEPYIDIEEPTIEDLKKNKIARKSYEKYKAIQGKLGQDIKKLNESRAKMKQNLELYAKKSLEQVKKLRNKKKEEPYINIEEPAMEDSKRKKIARKSYQKYKAIQGKLEKDIRKLNESKAKMKHSLQLHTKKSLEKVKQVKKKIKSNIHSGVRKSVQAVKALKPKDKAFESLELPEVDTDFKIKKDSITKFKDYLKKKEIMKDWECDLECEPETCVPDECFKIIKLKRLQKRNRQRGDKNTGNEMIRHEVKIGGTPLSLSSTVIQAQKLADTKGTHIKKQKAKRQGHMPATKYETIKREMKDITCKCKSFSSIQAKQSPLTTKTHVGKPKPLNQGNKQMATHQRTNRAVKLGMAPSSKSNSSVQSETFAKTKVTRIKKQKPILRGQSKNQLKGKRSVIESKEVNKVVKKKDVRRAAEKSAESLQQVKKGTIHKKGKTSQDKEEYVLEQEKRHPPGRQAVRITSSFSFNLEFYKTPSGSKTSRLSHSSGIHMHQKNRKVYRRHKGSQVMLNAAIESSQDIPERHKAMRIQTEKYEEFPIILQQTRLANMKTNTAYGTKYQSSVSSLTSSTNLKTTNKNISTARAQKRKSSQVSLLSARDTLKPRINNYLPNKQAVRIGSTFSFNVEFYRNNNENKIYTPIEARVKQTPTSDTPIEARVKQTPTSDTPIEARVKQTPTSFTTKTRNVKQKIVKVKGAPARAYNQAKNTVHKCICHLKPHKKRKTKKKSKSSTTSTVTVKSAPSRIDKYVGTKEKLRYKMPKTYQLLPYECEPGICVPGECDPIFCKKIIDLRKDKRVNKSVGSYTTSRKTKSASSIISKPVTAAKTVQSLVVPTKAGQTYTRRRYKEHLNLGHNIDTPERQAVRIGSSFSFNIEFYKNKQSPGYVIAENSDKSSFSNSPDEKKYKQHKFKDGGYIKGKKYNKPMSTQVVKKDKNIVPSLKRCFCTLKLYKNKMHNMKTVQKAKKFSSNTQTLGEVVIGDTVVNRGTKARHKHNYKLLPYECEPYVCIPGECDPHICLERIKRRKLNTRDNGVFTDRPEMVSMSSLANDTFKISEGTLIQHRLIPRGTDMKPVMKPRPKDLYNAESNEILRTNEAKQAVRVGSSFKFSIEFSKKLPGAVNITKYPNKRIYQKSQPKYEKESVITVKKLRVNHIDTQSAEPMRNHRTSLVRPMLKRCFCTLNLEKKSKKQHQKVDSKLPAETQRFGPQVYTVGRAMTDIISHSFGCQKKKSLHLTGSRKEIISSNTWLLSKYDTKLNSRYSILKFYSMTDIPMKLKQSLKIKSNISLAIEVMRQLGVCREDRICNMEDPIKTFSHIFRNHNYSNYIKLLRQPYFQNLNKVTDINRYLQQCFCIMNVRVSNPGVPHTMKKLKHKLKPYECEPGICIPGKCDPYECKKLIMRRFEKKAHKSSSTHSTNKSLSTYTTPSIRSDFRSTQIETLVRNQSQESIPLKYKTQRHLGSKQRQAVRLGSSFNFNLEFYKTQSQSGPHSYNPVPTQDETRSYSKVSLNKKPEKFIKNKKVQGNQKVGVDSGDSALMKRCFCTLKLQKKGKIHRENVKLNTQPINQSQVTLRNARIGTKVKYQKIPVVFNDLKSYECEPGICIPGQCDPYKCLEIIKRRKDFGINTTRNEKESVSSMTSEAYAKGRYKSRGLETISRRTYHKATKAVNGIDNYNQEVSRGTSRQAVRIGSSFSFNIEFFKDTSQGFPHLEPVMRQAPLIAPRSGTRQITSKKELRSIVSRNNKKVSHRNIQVEKPIPKNIHLSTEAKNHSIKTGDQPNKTSFKNRCLCILGLRKKEKDKQSRKKKSGQRKAKPTNKHPEKPVQTLEKPTNTNFRREVLISQLEPYECEPGICIPGQCNPYLCEKIIQQRMAKQYSRGSETASVRTHSISSNFGNKVAKHEKSQAQFQGNQKQIQHGQRLYKTSPPTFQTTFSPDRRVVRIGSNFSFDIEFFKGNGDGSEVKGKSELIKDYPTKYVQLKNLEHQNMLKSTGTKTPKNCSTRRKETQVKKKNSQTSGVNPLLQRCFCTLKLLNKPNNKKIKQKNHTKPKTKKSVETQSKKLSKGQLLQNGLREKPNILSPFECEPFTCIPGKCDPVECLKRIKRRNQTKDFSAVTNYPKSKSTGSVAKKNRHELLQAKLPSALPKRDVHNIYFGEEPQMHKSSNQSRQAVRIGSNFSFNIEFYKDIGNEIPKEIINKPLQEMNIQKHSQKSLHRQTRTQSTHCKHDISNNQSLSKNIQSNETGVQHLKRCFCTLQLQKKNLCKYENRKIQSDQPKSYHSSVGNFLKKCVCTLKLNKVGKQQKIIGPSIENQYAVKGTSTEHVRHTPGLIKKPVRLLDPYECEPYFCVPGECDPYECLKRIQQRQVRHFGTEHKQYLKDSATDSVKQPMTRSIKSQYHQKRKWNSRGTSFVSKYRPSKDTAPFSSQPSDNNNRQTVRIGSNFSFNIEFFKDSGMKNNEINDISQFKSKKASKIKAGSEKLRIRPIGSNTTVKRKCSKNSQSKCLKKYGKNSADNTVPRRCFCTLKLLNKNTDHPEISGKIVPTTKITKDKTTATKVKYAVPHELGVYDSPPLMSIPGECNPNDYERLDKMKNRGIIRRCRNTGTRIRRTSTESIGILALNKKGRKNQVVKNRNVGAFNSHSEPHSEILQSSRMHENFDRQTKRAVRIGSNFNFNVEFFKRKSQPGMITFQKSGKARHNEKESKSYFNKNVTAGARNVRHFNSQMDNVKIQDQGSDAGNLLKRCFCTLQLQNSTRQKLTRKNKKYKNAPGINVTYPQTITVGRVAIVPCKNFKSDRLRNTDKARSSCIDPKLFHKTVGTETKKKYLQNNDLSQCNPNNCLNYSRHIFRKNNRYDMQTLLPYTPSKFNRKESKTLVKYCEADNPKDTLNIGKGKRRLTAKQGRKVIPTNTLQSPSNYNNSFFCRCINFFTRRSETRSNASRNQENINNMIPQQKNEYSCERRHKSEDAQIKLNVICKKSNQKPTKALIGQTCPNICPNNKWYSKFQKSNAGNNILKTENIKIDDIKSKKLGRDEKDSKSQKMRVTFADSVKASRNDIAKGKKIKSVHSKSSKKSRLCCSCSEKDCPSKSKNSRNGKKPVSYSESADDCQYCECCKRRIDMNEICKGGGDKRSTTSSHHKQEINTCPCDNASVDGNERKQSLSKKPTVNNISPIFSMKKCKCCMKNKPLFEMQVDSLNYGIINKSEVKLKVDQLRNNNYQAQHSQSIMRHGPCDNASVDGNEREQSLSKKPTVDNISHIFSMKKCKCCVKNKPLFEMKVDPVNYGIINKREVRLKVDELGNNNYQAQHSQSVMKHGPLWRCSKCILKFEQRGAKISVAAKGPIKIGSPFKSCLKKIFLGLFVKPRAPCTCGSKKCAVESKRSTRSTKGERKGRKCTCRSRICNEDFKRLKKERDKVAMKAKRKAQHIKHKEYMKDMKEVYKRLKIERKKDEIRRRKRIKRNKKLEATVKKYKDSSDTMLAIDSLVDIGKFGVSSLGGALRYTAKSLYDPKVAFEKCKICKKNDPESINKALTQIQKDYNESDAAAIARRLKMRCLFMKKVRSIREKMEDNVVTHFILHMADKDPKTRQFKPKPKRPIREPLDFQCSLYMGSLRRRPHLSVYYKCPSFYPHFVTMLNIWRQFTDIMLFLLAALVWSPCILCMEGCRAVLCCFFCTG